MIALPQAQAGPAGQDDGGREAFRRHARPRVAELLGAVGLEVIYHRGEGDYLFYRGDDGREVRVLDLLGGFGASLFGHNHPDLVASAMKALAEGRPFNAQASVRGRAGLLAQRLSRLVGETTGREYVATMASSGAEVVEAALKHAELAMWERNRKAIAEVRAAGVLAGQELEAGRATAPPGFLADAARRLGEAECRSVAELAQRVEARARAAFRAPATVVAMAGGFHGKTSGALKLTHNIEYRHPWERWGSALFLSRGDAVELRAKLARADLEYFRLAVDGGRLVLEPRAVSNVAACFAEPIQGEGGINELAPAYLRELRAAADRHGFPLILDEIQSGMGRTGTFLASEAAGVRGDYYLLSKSLGGGLAKMAALLVDRAHYLPDFGYLHTSTFAEDDFSCTVALAALDLVERDGRRLLRQCREKGAYLIGRLREVHARYPEQIRDVRGRGLLVGVELRPQLRSRSALLRVLSEQRLLGFFAAGYLLHEERIRVAPGLSSHGTIRIEPSAEIGQAELDHTCDALERLCRVIRDSDVYRFSRFAAAHCAAPLGLAGPEPEEEAQPPRPSRLDHDAQPVAFLVHYMRPEDLRRLEPGMSAFDRQACAAFIERTRGVLKPFVAERALVRSPAGASVDLSFILVPFSADQVMQAIRSRSFGWALTLVKDGVELARSLGCASAGLGGHTSIVTNNCTAVVTDEIALTSGNALTVASAVDALLAAAARHRAARRRLGVVGATGNIGAMIAELAAPEVDEIVLVGRPGAHRRLTELAAQLGGRAQVATDLSALRECSLIVSASNSPTPILLPEHIGDAEPVVICDVAVPGDVDPGVAAARPNARVIGGGLMRLPLGQSLGRLGVEGAPGLIYACMAETILLGFARSERHFSYGALTAEQVRFMRDLARAHGFTTEEKVL